MVHHVIKHVKRAQTLGAGTLFTSAMLWHNFRCLDNKGETFRLVSNSQIYNEIYEVTDQFALVLM